MVIKTGHNLINPDTPEQQKRWLFHPFSVISTILHHEKCRTIIVQPAFRLIYTDSTQESVIFLEEIFQQIQVFKF